MNSEDLKKRTKTFALSIIRFIAKLPKNNISSVLGRQLLRSASSVGANYRAACRAKSRQDFIFKIKIVESCYWLELIEESAIISKKEIEPLEKESDELTAIFTAILKTSKQNSN